MHRFAGRGVSPLTLSAALIVVMAAGCQRPSSRPAALSPSPSPLPIAHKTDPASVAWERSVRAGYIVPMRAHVVVSRWADIAKAKEWRTEMDVLTDGAGRYRHTYVAPGIGAGRVVLSDSRTNYQYEPTRNAVLRRPEIAPEPAEMISPPHLKHSCAPKSPALLGRPTQLIVTTATRDDGSAYLWEKRWADADNGRSLKTETYSPSGRLVRRFEIMRVSFPAAVQQEAFRPDFPTTARTIAATTPKLQSAVTEAARLGLPQEAQGFRLQSAARPLAARTGTTPTTHLIYSDGTRTVSVFVVETGRPLSPSPFPVPEWRSLSLAEGVIAYARHSRDDAHTVLVWTKDTRRYTAVSQLPLEDWLPAARALTISE